MHETLVFTATYNEAENIKEFINEIFKINKNIDLLIVDDNSPDKTYEVIENLKSNYKNIFLIRRSMKLGLNTAHILAYEYALENKYTKLITLDADMSHDPREIPKIINLLDNNPFVVGSRYMQGGKNDMSHLRYFISSFGNKLIKFLLKSEGTEFTTSYRGFNLNKLSNFHFNQIEARGYSFFMSTVIRLNKLGHKSKEFPIHFKNRHYGKSKIPQIEIFRTFFTLLKFYFKK